MLVWRLTNVSFHYSLISPLSIHASVTSHKLSPSEKTIFYKESDPHWVIGMSFIPSDIYLWVFISFVFGSQNGSSWKGPQKMIWSNLPAPAGSSQSTKHRIVSRQVFNISSEGHSIPSLGNLFHKSPSRQRNSSSYSGGTIFFRSSMTWVVMLEISCVFPVLKKYQVHHNSLLSIPHRESSFSAYSFSHQLPFPFHFATSFKHVICLHTILFAFWHDCVKYFACT